MMLAQAGEGTGGLIRSAIGDITAARAQYDAEKGRNAWTLRIEGRDNRSFENINGEYPVRGPWRESGFIVDAEDGARSVCRQATCDWYADHAVLVRGQPEITTTTTVRLGKVRVAVLSERFRQAEEGGKVLISGTFKAKNVPPDLPTLDAGADTVRLAYAEPEVIRALNGFVSEVDLVVQVRHAPGIESPEINIKDESASSLNPLLKRWVY